MPETPSLELRIISAIDGAQKQLTRFIDYEIDHDLLTADGAFAINLVPDFSDQADQANMPVMGDIAELLIYGQRVLSGYIESVSRRVDKQGGRQYAVYGRSTSAILIDNAIRPDGGMWTTHANTTLQAMFAKLLGQLPAEIRPRMGAVPPEAAVLTVEITPGDTYWDIMARLATARGVYLVCLSDGSLALRTLAEDEKAAQFTIECGTPTANALEATITYDETKRYANIIVISQDAEQTTGAVITDPKAIFQRTIVVNPEQDGQNVNDYGKLYRAKQIKESQQYEYIVEGHEQGGNVWAVGAGCAVKDTLHGIDQTLLISGVTFTLSKQEGRRTVIRLCPYLEA